MRGDAFRLYVDGALTRHPGLQALSWNAHVGWEELEAFERRHGFQGTERSAAGVLVPVSPRPAYTVVTYIEPHGPNWTALGYDIASEPTRKAALDAATGGAEPAATALL